MIPQNTPEWVKARVGCLGASMMPTVMLPRNKDGSEKAARINLKKAIVAERLTGFAVDHFVSDAMRWGIEKEEDAKAAYEVLRGNILLPAGWVEHPTLMFAGATPDALIDSDGVLECKCPTTPTHMDWLMAGIVPPEYRPQMAFQLLCTRREFADFISWDPRMPKKQRAFIRRFRPTVEYLAEVESAAAAFLKEVDDLFEAVTTAEAVAA